MNGAIEKVLSFYPDGELIDAARAELAEKAAETEELRRLLGVQIAVHATESRELAAKDTRIERLTAALDEAARSLTAIAIADTEDGNEYLKDVRETRRFAGSRAEVAREDLSMPTDGESRLRGSQDSAALSGAPTTAKLVPVERLLLAFVDGAKWWEYRETGATMWQSDQRGAYLVAEERLAARTLAVPVERLAALLREEERTAPNATDEDDEILDQPERSEVERDCIHKLRRLMERIVTVHTTNMAGKPLAPTDIRDLMRLCTEATSALLSCAAVGLGMGRDGLGGDRG